MDCARQEREKLRRKMIFQQENAQLEIQQSTMREATLLRQSQQERCIAQKLLHIRHEKDLMLENRNSKQLILTKLTERIDFV